MDYKRYLINGLDLGELEDVAERKLREAKTLKIFNNSTRVGPDEIKRQMGLIDAADLVIIDHLQYIDNDPDKSEYAQTSSTMKLIKDLTKIKKIPIVLVSHLRKKDRFRNFPDNDDFHGSSNIAKEAETCIIIFRNKQVHSNKSDTIIRVTKCRHGSERQHMGRINFNPVKGTYDKEYTLVYPDGKDLVEFSLGDLPHWAR